MLKKRILGIFLLNFVVVTPSIAGLDQAISLQRMQDGQFSIICDSGKYENANVDSIRANEICHEASAPELELKSGTYADASGYYCEQGAEAVYQNGKLTNINLRYLSSCSGHSAYLSCEGNQCIGYFDGKDRVSITVTGSDTYSYLGISGPERSFQFVSSSVKVEAGPSKSKTDRR